MKKLISAALMALFLAAGVPLKADDMAKDNGQTMEQGAKPAKKVKKHKVRKAKKVKKHKAKKTTAEGTEGAEAGGAK